MIKENKLNMVVDAQWGSTGKGKLCSFLYENYKIDVAISNNMPNAGHVSVIKSPSGRTEKFVLKALPTGALYPGIKCFIGPYSVIDVNRLTEEINEIVSKLEHLPEVYIHPMACVLTPENVEQEKQLVSGISSTGQGSCSAVMQKMARLGNAYLFKNYNGGLPIRTEIKDYSEVYSTNNSTLLAEGSQGHDLSLNWGTSYPYVTSRDCNVGTMLENSGVSCHRIGNIIASIRTFPIRVGSVGDGTSGPYWDDQQELCWKDLGVMAEYTTVTKRVRRVFTYSRRQIEKFCRIVGPTHAFLNFVNYLEEETAEDFIKMVEKDLKRWGCVLSLLGTGPKSHEVINL